MRRPARTRDVEGMHGYVVAPALAWSGWRLRVPGGPEGGQYHGYTGDDSDQEATMLSGPESSWNPVWGGTALLEGETVSDHVYRSPGEVRPRANASGGANVLREYQTKRTAGYAVAPGNYAALGLMPSDAALENMSRVYMRPPVRPVLPVRPLPPVVIGWPAGATDITLPAPVNIVAQPGPKTPVPVYTVGVRTEPPVSPAPAPTVAASAADFLPAQGQPLPGATATTPLNASGSVTDIGAWLQASSIWSAVPNWVLLAGAGLLLFSGRSGGRR